MLGEDETLAKNRLVLLCQNCRLVNGQAPPSVKTLEELGKWRCQSCGAWNGTQTEALKVVQEMTEKRPEKRPVSTVKSEKEELDVSRSAIGEPESQYAEEEEGTSGADHSSKSGSVTRRTTRSAGKAELEGI